jgi:nitrite reductase (NADH) small subunit
MSMKLDGDSYVVCRVPDLPPGERIIAPIGKFGVGVFNVNGTFRALTNYCPHEGGPLCIGPVRGATTVDEGAIGGVGWIRENEIVKCPWHQWEFDIASGTTLTQPERKIRTYPVEVIDDMVVLRLSSRRG